MDSRSEMQVKIDFFRKSLEVLILKGHKIAQLVKNIFYLHFLNPYFWAFKKITLNCHISETGMAFDLIPTLRAGPKYQVSYGSLVVKY